MLVLKKSKSSHLLIKHRSDSMNVCLIILLCVAYVCHSVEKQKDKGEVKEENLSIPLIDSDNAPLFAKLDTTKINQNLKVYIKTLMHDMMSTSFTEQLDKIHYFQNISEEIIAMEERLKAKMNNEVQQLSLQLKKNTMQLKKENPVALTACVASSKKYHGPVIFASIKTNTGINNLESFKSAGKFQVTTRGLYFVSAYLWSHTKGQPFFLKRNDTILVKSATSSSSGWSSSSIVSIVEANENDMIYVYGNGIYSDASYSCLSIIKVK